MFICFCYMSHIKQEKHCHFVACVYIGCSVLYNKMYIASFIKKENYMKKKFRLIASRRVAPRRLTSAC